MATTKQDIVSESFEDIGYNTPIDASLISVGVRELRNMCLSLQNDNVYVNFNNTDANLPTDESGISFTHRDAIVKNLAVRLAEIYDVIVNPSYSGRADTLLNGITPFVIPEYEANPFLPEGAGDKLYDQQYFFNNFQYPDEVFYTSVGEKVAAIKQLNDDNVDGNIVSAEWTTETSTITITDPTLNGTVAEAMVQFTEAGDFLVKVLATYDSGEIDAKCLVYQVSECRQSPNLYRYPNGNRI